MLLPEQKYISMVQATKEFQDVTIEKLKGLIEEKLLPAYIRSQIPPYRYAKVREPHWSGDAFNWVADILYNEGETIDPDNCVLYYLGSCYGNIFIRPTELRVLDQSEINKNKLTESESEEKRKCNLPDRADGAIVPPRSKAPITIILEYVFEQCESSNPVLLKPGNWKAFYEFIKKEVTKEAKLSNKQSIAYYIEKVVTTGGRPGIKMRQPIEGRADGTGADYWYSKEDITPLISRIRKKHKNQK